MSRHDYTLDNASGASLRADLNSALQAVATQNEGTGVPATTFPGLEYIDDALGLLMRRNQGDTLSFPVDNSDYIRYTAKSAVYPIVAGDMAKLIEGNTASAAVTFTLPANSAVSAVGGGWWCLVRNSGSAGNNLTIDGNGSETVNGVAAITLGDGEAALIWSTGTTAWRALYFLDRHPTQGTIRAIGSEPGVEINNPTEPQKWFVGESAAALIIRDITGGNTVPFQLAAGAPTAALAIDADGVTTLKNTPATTGDLGPLVVDRLANDGKLIDLRRAGVSVGDVSVASGVVSYGTFVAHHPSRWASGEEPVAEPAVGTLVETVDEPCVHLEIVREVVEPFGEGRVRVSKTATARARLPEGSALRLGAEGVEEHVYRDPKTGQLVKLPLRWWVEERVRPQLACVRVCREPGSRRVYGVYAGRQQDGDIIIHALGAVRALVEGRAAGGDLLVSGGDGVLVSARPGLQDPPAEQVVGKVTIGDDETGRRLVACALWCG